LKKKIVPVDIKPKVAEEIQLAYTGLDPRNRGGRGT
jgi:hypothetical protein